jgi:hypothetical protein
LTKESGVLVKQENKLEMKKLKNNNNTQSKLCSKLKKLRIQINA